MTTLASIEAVRLSCPRRPRGAFSPVVLIGGDHPMTEHGPTAGGGGIDGGVSGRFKRDLELGGEVQPPPPKRMSPIPPRGQDSTIRDHHPHMDASRLGDGPSGLSLGNIVAATVPVDSMVRANRGVPPRGRSRQSSPFRSDGLHPQYTRESAQSIIRAHTTSPPKADPVVSTVVNGNRPVRSLSVMNCAISAELWKTATSTSGACDSVVKPCSTARAGAGAVAGGGGGEGSAGTSAMSLAPSMLMNYRRDVLKPSPQQNIGSVGSVGASSRSAKDGNTLAAATAALGSISGERDNGGDCGGWGFGGRGDQRGADSSRVSTSDESPGGSRRSMKRPLGGGLRASSSWDGGSASNAPPGSGGGFSAAPACRSCGGGGRGSVGDAGQGEDGQEGETCSCKGLRASLCLSPLPFSRTNSLDVGGHDSRRHGVGEEDFFMLSHLSYTFSPLSSPAVGSQAGVSSGGGDGDGGGGAEGLEMLDGGGDMPAIADCMQTLLGNPSHDSAGFGMSPFDRGMSPGDGLEATGGDGKDESNHSNGEMDVESPQGSRLDGNHLLHGGMGVPGSGMGSVVGNGDVGPKVGDNYQAVIPTLSTLSANGDYRLSPQRSPPLQLWKPGTVSDTAAEFAFPKPRPNGPGSAELEQKLLAAYLIHRAEEETGWRRDPDASASVATGGCGGAGLGVASARVSGVAVTGGSIGGSGGNSIEQDTSSLESLSELVAQGEGARWRTDWTPADQDSFRRGVYAFRRNFQRIRAKFLPTKTHGDVVEYFYRRWKRNPDYTDWKGTDQLVGRRVAKVSEERFAAMRYGYVAGKDVSLCSGVELLFRVVFPRSAPLEAESELVDLGTLETMLVEGFVAEEQKRSESKYRPRVAATIRGALASSGLHHSFEGARDGGSGGSAGGGSSGIAGGLLGAGLGTGASGRRLGWNAHADSGYHYAPGLGHDRGYGRGGREGGGGGSCSRRAPDGDEGQESVRAEEGGDGEQETEGNDGDGGGSGSSDSGPDAETDSTTSVSAGGTGESPVSTSPPSFAGQSQANNSTTSEAAQQQQLAQQLAHQFPLGDDDEQEGPTSAYSPIRTMSSIQQQQQQLLLQQTPPLLPPPQETLHSNSVQHRWSDAEGLAADTGGVGLSTLPEGAATGFGGYQLADDGSTAAAVVAAGGTKASHTPGR